MPISNPHKTLFTASTCIQADDIDDESFKVMPWSICKAFMIRMSSSVQQLLADWHLEAGSAKFVTIVARPWVLLVHHWVHHGNADCPELERNPCRVIKERLNWKASVNRSELSALHRLQYTFQFYCDIMCTWCAPWQSVAHEYSKKY